MQAIASPGAKKPCRASRSGPFSAGMKPRAGLDGRHFLGRNANAFDGPTMVSDFWGIGRFRRRL
jgi:hypothetical protein